MPDDKDRFEEFTRSGLNNACCQEKFLKLIIFSPELNIIDSMP
jgi:hypothetical protein